MKIICFYLIVRDEINNLYCLKCYIVTSFITGSPIAFMNMEKSHKNILIKIGSKIDSLGLPVTVSSIAIGPTSLFYFIPIFEDICTNLSLEKENASNYHE